jgi:apolipoprotein N-acyltransferase
MRLNSAFNADSDRPENWANRLFEFFGLMVFCIVILLALSAASFLWNDWTTGDPSDSTRWHMIAVIRGLLLTGIVWMTAGAFFVGNRRIVAGVLLLLGVAVFLNTVGDR